MDKLENQKGNTDNKKSYMSKKKYLEAKIKKTYAYFTFG